jgi:4-amino-4-deoxy-L-arabinose transferase-like glycosyltransferase
MNNKIRIFLLSLIVILGFLLRIIQLNVSPSGFNADEAALGYNAYSIIQTGKDEWNQPLPLVFKSFSDYKPGLYVYLDIPFVWAFGLTELAVRLPSILLGTLSVFLIYLLAKHCFKKETVALSAALLLAINPWSIHFSRGAWETNVATFFILLGVLLFVKGYKSWKWLLAAGLSFDAAVYTYQSTRLVAPLIALLMVGFYWKKLLNKKNLISLFIVIIFLLPVIIISTNSSFLSRFQGVSIFSDVGPINKINQERGQDSDPSSLSAKIFHNKIIAYGTNFISHYLDHFNPNFLFISGDPLQRNKTPDMGQFYLFEIITILIGLYFAIKEKFQDVKVIFIWLIVSPLAASLTYQTPHALRAENMVMPLTLISGLGLGMILEKILTLKRFFSVNLVFILSFVIIFSIVFYLHQYYIHLPKEYGLEWQYGFSQMVPYVLENQDKYEKIVITDRYYQPYILQLFYSRYNPSKYQSITKKEGDNKFGFTTVTSFDKYEFRPISKEDLVNSKNTLFVGSGEEIKQGNVIKEINYLNGLPAFKIVGI